MANHNLELNFKVDNEDEGDDAPGAFKRPKSAFTLARSDLKSKEWQSEIEGLEAMVRLFKWHKLFLSFH